MNRRHRLLLADDSEPIISAFRAILVPKYEIIETVTNGRAALEAVDRLAPDLVLLDIRMPDLNRFQVAEKLKQRRPSIKTVLASAHTEPGYLRKAIRLGMDGYVLKMWATTELPEAIQTVLEGGSFWSPHVILSPPPGEKDKNSTRVRRAADTNRPY